MVAVGVSSRYVEICPRRGKPAFGQVLCCLGRRRESLGDITAEARAFENVLYGSSRFVTVVVRDSHYAGVEGGFLKLSKTTRWKIDVEWRDEIQAGNVFYMWRVSGLMLR